MSVLKHVLFHSPWVPYNNKFIQSRLVLTYPENVIFTAQFIKHLSNLSVYTEYPYAERMHLWDLDQIDWSKTLIVFDRDLQLLFAPEQIEQLVRLDRRLHHREAAAAILEPFQFLPSLALFQYQWLGLLLIFVLHYSTSWLTATRYKAYSLALSNKPSARSRDPDR